MAEPGDQSRRPRRFYKDVSIAAEPDGFSLRLDDRAARTPGARALTLPTGALAQLVAEEWRAQTESVAMVSMPATRLAHTAIDVIADARDASLTGVTRFAESDLLCYFAEHPAALVQRQHRVWDPLLDWARLSQHLPFSTTSGIIHRPQPSAVFDRLQALGETLDTFSLAGLAFASALFGSVILALALRDGRIGAEAAMGASRLDEIYQQELWGVDAEAEAKADAMAIEAVMVERWFAALA